VWHSRRPALFLMRDNPGFSISPAKFR